MHTVGPAIFQWLPRGDQTAYKRFEPYRFYESQDGVRVGVPIPRHGNKPHAGHFLVGLAGSGLTSVRQVDDVSTRTRRRIALGAFGLDPYRMFLSRDPNSTRKATLTFVDSRDPRDTVGEAVQLTRQDMPREGWSPEMHGAFFGFKPDYVPIGVVGDTLIFQSAYAYKHNDPRAYLAFSFRAGGIRVEPVRLEGDTLSVDGEILWGFKRLNHYHTDRFLTRLTDDLVAFALRHGLTVASRINETEQDVFYGVLQELLATLPVIDPRWPSSRLYQPSSPVVTTRLGLAQALGLDMRSGTPLPAGQTEDEVELTEEIIMPAEKRISA